MNRITSILAMHARDRGTWFVIPWSVMGAGFVIVWLIALFVRLLRGGQEETFTGALAVFYFVMLVGGINSIGGTFSFAVGFGARRRDYFLGTVAIAAAVSAASAIALTLLSFIEAEVIRNWGVGLHFFHLPFFSDGAPLRLFCWTSDTVCAQADPRYVGGDSPLQQTWFSFVFLLFLCLLGLLLGAIYQRFGRSGIYMAAGGAFLLISVFLLLSSYWRLWGAILGWLARQTAATLGVWLVPAIVFFTVSFYALLRKASV